MYSGFITPRRTLSAVGVHQRLDAVAFRMAQPFFAEGTFPSLRQILHFEGINGPDGLKVKSPGQQEPGHLYNPQTESGEIPELIEAHYGHLVHKLREHDLVRAGFEAAWLAHYVCDGLTPAHHFPLSERLAEHASGAKPTSRYKHAVLVSGDTPSDVVKRSWAVWGTKGLLTTHFNFEMGVATALVGYRIKVKLDHARLAKARAQGPLAFFKDEARDIAALKMYETFYAKGWTPGLARVARNRLAPQSAQAIAIIWMLAYLEAGLDDARLAAGERK